MDKQFRLRSAQVVGRDHLFSRRNNQDAYAQAVFKYEFGEYAVGVVADGCGQGRSSEVGARLGVKFILSEIARLFKSGLSNKDIPKTLFPKIIGFLEGVIEPYKFESEEKAAFIMDHLLFTINGFISGPDETVVFSYGDGLVILNQDIDLRDQRGQPDYIAYHLVSSAFGLSLPTTFDLYTIETQRLQKLAIATDGWVPELDLILEGSIWNFQHPIGLQRKMNVWSEREKRFKDDATIITLEIL